MFSRKPFPRGVSFISLTVLYLATPGSPGQDKTSPSADVAKGAAIQKPAEAIVAKGSSAVSRTSNPTGGKIGTDLPARDKFVNPKIEPGLVKWHPSFAAACEAAGKSGKPVFLLQMMGKLDDQFC